MRYCSKVHCDNYRRIDGQTRPIRPDRVACTIYLTDIRNHHLATHIAQAIVFYLPKFPTRWARTPAWAWKFELANDTSNGGYRREDKSHKHWLIFFKPFSSVTAIFFICYIKSRAIVCKSQKNRIEPNELDELIYSKSLTQTTSYAYWHAFLYLHA